MPVCLGISRGLAGTLRVHEACHSFKSCQSTFCLSVLYCFLAFSAGLPTHPNYLSVPADRAATPRPFVFILAFLCLFDEKDMTG